MAGQTIQVSVLADTKRFSRAMRDLSEKSGLSKLGSMAATAGKAVAAGLGVASAAAGALAVKAVGAASNLQQSVGAVDAIFKENAATIHEWANGAAEAVGLSANSYNELASLIGAQLKNGGTAMDELAGKTDELIGTGADLAAMFGGTTADAVGALSSALKGERDPIERYGVSLNQAAIDAKAAELGFQKVGGSLSAEANQAATLAIIMEQTADAHGAFGRESNTLAGQQQRLQAKLQNITATIGTYLLPVLTTAATWLNDRVGPAFESLAGWIEGTAVPALQTFGEWLQANVLPVLQQLGAWITDTVVPALQSFGAFLTDTVVPALQAAAQWVQQNSAWLIPLATALGTAAVAYMAIQRAMLLYQAVVNAVKAAQLALNLAMSANPVGIIIALVAGLVAGLVVLWNTNEGFREAVIGVWEAIKTGIGAAIGWVQEKIGQLGQVPGQVGAWFGRAKDSAVNALGQLVSWVAGVPGRVTSALASLGSRLLSTAVSAFAQLVTGARRKGDELLSWVRGIPGRITGALGNLGQLLLGAGRSVIDGFLGGITGAFGRVRDKLSELTNLLPDWKGPAKKDRNILRNAGRLVIEGFNSGLQDRFSRVRGTLSRFTRQLADTAMPTLTPTVALAGVEPLPADGWGGSRFAGPAPRTYSITVQALTPTAEVGRAVVKAISDYERLNGGDR